MQEGGAVNGGKGFTVQGCSPSTIKGGSTVHQPKQHLSSRGTPKYKRPREEPIYQSWINLLPVERKDTIAKRMHKGHGLAQRKQTWYTIIIVVLKTWSAPTPRAQ